MSRQSGHEDWINAVAFSPDRRWLATCSDDTSARLWELTASDPAAPIVLRGHSSWVQSVPFSPDGRWLAISSFDATAQMWDLTASNSWTASKLRR